MFVAIVGTVTHKHVITLNVNILSSLVYLRESQTEICFKFCGVATFFKTRPRLALLATKTPGIVRDLFAANS